MSVQRTPGDRLLVDLTDDWWEPICGKCGQPIPWVLDMMSFHKVGGYFEAAHARCVWTKEGFRTQQDRAAS